MKSNLLILGAGGHGRVVADAAESSEAWNKIAFIDEKYPDLGASGRWPVIGKTADLSELLTEWPDAVVAIGANTLRLELLKLCSEKGFNVVNIIHTSARVAEDVSLGNGTVIFASAVINTGASLGQGCIVNTAASVDHDCSLAEGVHLSPGVHLGGTVSVGSRSWVGIGSSVVNNIRIGSDVIVGAGAAVISNVRDNHTVVGVPAKQITTD